MFSFGYCVAAVPCTGSLDLANLCHLSLSVSFRINPCDHSRPESCAHRLHRLLHPPPRPLYWQTVVSGIEDLGREAGVSLRESSVKPQFEALVSASDELKKGLASAKTNKQEDVAQVRTCGVRTHIL